PGPLTIGVSVPMFFFFQAEDGIRDLYVTGVQTCALPIFGESGFLAKVPGPARQKAALTELHPQRIQPDRPRRRGAVKPCVEVQQIGRASCREKVLTARGIETIEKIREQDSYRLNKRKQEK